MGNVIGYYSTPDQAKAVVQALEDSNEHELRQLIEGCATNVAVNKLRPLKSQPKSAAASADKGTLSPCKPTSSQEGQQNLSALKGTPSPSREGQQDLSSDKGTPSPSQEGQQVLSADKGTPSPSREGQQVLSADKVSPSPSREGQQVPSTDKGSPSPATTEPMEEGQPDLLSSSGAQGEDNRSPSTVQESKPTSAPSLETPFSDPVQEAVSPQLSLLSPESLTASTAKVLKASIEPIEQSSVTSSKSSEPPQVDASDHGKTAEKSGSSGTASVAPGSVEPASPIDLTTSPQRTASLRAALGDCAMDFDLELVGQWTTGADLRCGWPSDTSSLTGGRLAGRRPPMSNAPRAGRRPRLSFQMYNNDMNAAALAKRVNVWRQRVTMNFSTPPTGKKVFAESQLLNAIVLRERLIALEGSVPAQHMCSGWPQRRSKWLTAVLACHRHDQMAFLMLHLLKSLRAGAFLPQWNTSVGHLSLLNTAPSVDHISGAKEKDCTGKGVDSKVDQSASGDALKEKGTDGCENNVIVRVETAPGKPGVNSTGDASTNTTTPAFSDEMLGLERLLRTDSWCHFSMRRFGKGSQMFATKVQQPATPKTSTVLLGGGATGDRRGDRLHAVVSRLVVGKVGERRGAVTFQETFLDDELVVKYGGGYGSIHFSSPASVVPRVVECPLGSSQTLEELTQQWAAELSASACREEESDAPVSQANLRPSTRSRTRRKSPLPTVSVHVRDLRRSRSRLGRSSATSDDSSDPVDLTKDKSKAGTAPSDAKVPASPRSVKLTDKKASTPGPKTRRGQSPVATPLSKSAAGRTRTSATNARSTRGSPRGAAGKPSGNDAAKDTVKVAKKNESAQPMECEGGEPDREILQEDSEPAVDTTSSQGTSEPAVDTASSQGSSEPAVHTASSQGSSEPAVHTASSQGSSEPAVDMASSQGNTEPAVGTASAPSPVGDGPTDTDPLATRVKCYPSMAGHGLRARMSRLFQALREDELPSSHFTLSRKCLRSLARRPCSGRALDGFVQTSSAFFPRPSLGTAWRMRTLGAMSFATIALQIASLQALVRTPPKHTPLLGVAVALPCKENHWKANTTGLVVARRDLDPDGVVSQYLVPCPSAELEKQDKISNGEDFFVVSAAAAVCVCMRVCVRACVCVHVFAVMLSAMFC